MTKLVRQTTQHNDLFRISLVHGLLALAIGCSAEVPEPVRETERALTHRIAATNYPLAFFATKIVGDVATVAAIVPASGQPGSDQIVALQDSDLVFVNGNGAPFAQWLPHVTLPDSRVVQTATDGIPFSELIAVEDIRVVHSHGPEGEHSHATMVAQTWLDPALARKQAKVIAERLAIVYPQAAESIGARAAKLDERLLELQRQVEKVAGEVQRGQMVVTATPEVKFFTRALGIEDRHQNWIEFPPAPEVAKELETLKELNADEPTKPRWLLVTQPPSPEIRSAIESAEFQIIEFETLGQPPRSGDYFDTMLRNLDRMTSVLQHRTARP